MIPRLAITCGEPAGIGVDLVLQIAQKSLPAHCVVIADPEVLKSRSKQLGLAIDFIAYDATAERQTSKAGEVTVLPVTCPTPVRAGELDVRNAPYVLQTLERHVHSLYTQCLPSPQHLFQKVNGLPHFLL